MGTACGAPYTCWKVAISASPRFFCQLKDGEQLYASSLPGNLAWMPSANFRAYGVAHWKINLEYTLAWKMAYAPVH